MLRCFIADRPRPRSRNRVQRIHGNRNELPTHRRDFERLAPDVDDRRATSLMETCRGLTGRVVAISSQDVYRAYGVLLHLEPGPPQPTPLDEESDVRTQLHLYNVDHLRMAQAAFPWITGDYDKIPVERTVFGDSCVCRWFTALAIHCTAFFDAQ
jgi:hypothetical protein